MTTGERIRLFREAKGITQEELAGYLGIKKQTIWKYENGAITNVPLDRIEQMAPFLGVTPADITGWTSSSNAADKEAQEAALIAAYWQSSEELRQAALRILKG